MFPTHHILFLSAIIFSVGLMTVITKRNTIMMLIGIELMLNAANLNLVAFNRNNPELLAGQFFSLFVIVVAVCEAAVGLALIVRMYKYYQTSVPGDANELKEH